MISPAHDMIAVQVFSQALRLTSWLEKKDDWIRLPKGKELCSCVCCGEKKPHPRIEITSLPGQCSQENANKDAGRKVDSHFSWEIPPTTHAAWIPLGRAKGESLTIACHGISIIVALRARVVTSSAPLAVLLVAVLSMTLYFPRRYMCTVNSIQRYIMRTGVFSPA